MVTKPYLDGVGFVVETIEKRVEWSGGNTRGLKAAMDCADRLNAEPLATERTAPIGTVRSRFTAKEVCYETVEKRTDGRPLGLHYRYVIIEWSNVEKRVPCACGSVSVYATAPFLCADCDLENAIKNGSIEVAE